MKGFFNSLTPQQQEAALAYEGPENFGFPGPTPPERITGVALLTSDGRMVALPKPHRHHHLFSVCALLGIEPDHSGDAEQGFTTHDGRFVGRGEALMMVREAGQPMRNPNAQTQLYSEDLW